MAYTPKLWEDKIKDADGKIIQAGTPFSAGNMNHIEQGIADAHSKLEGAERQTQVLQHGLSVLNGDVGAPVSLQIEGRTLVPMQNTVLDPQRYYVLADKKTKIKFADGTILSGVNKFTARAEKPSIIRVANYENKVAGSLLENPHKSTVGTRASLEHPSSYTAESSSDGYNLLSNLDGKVNIQTTNILNQGAQRIFEYNIIEEIERKVGRIPRSSVADKVAWLKANIAKITCNWWGYGSSPSGNKASFTVFLANSNMWWTATDSFHTNPTVTKLTRIPGSISDLINSEGYVYCIAYADPSDGVTPSTIYTDYVELVIELKPDAILHDPRVPLYEVTKENYDKILVSWLEDEVIKRYPPVEGVKHIQNPFVMAEGDNLLPPFYVWTNNSVVTVKSPYEIEINKTETSQTSEYLLDCLPNTTYTLTYINELNGNVDIYTVDAIGNYTLVQEYTPLTRKTFTTNVTAKKIRIRFVANVNGLAKISKPMLTLGSLPKPFVPRNPSYLFIETKLGQIGDKKDILFEQDGKYFKRKVNELDIVVDGSLNWSYGADYTGYKRFNLPISSFPFLGGETYRTSKYDGKLLKYDSSGQYQSNDIGYIATTGSLIITVSDVDTGFADSYAPTSDEVKAYFNGWQVKTSDGTGKPTAWKSILDGTDAPTQTLAYVSTNKAANYTSYKLSYVLANPVTEEIKVEGAISVNGLTQAEVGSGVILKEKAKVFTTATNAYINRYDGVYGASILNNKALKIMNVYKNGVLDNHNWTWGAGSSGYGKDYLWTEIKKYDPTAEYTVTYLIYNRENITANITAAQATYANNIRTSLEDTVKKVEDNTTSLTVQANILYDVLKRLKAGGM
ncbi:hypothetical protein P4V34_28545 [Bacillus thuringiensis]|nr:hypothetical protein [Bacillus thuringiensis]